MCWFDKNTEQMLLSLFPFKFHWKYRRNVKARVWDKRESAVRSRIGYFWSTEFLEVFRIPQVEGPLAQPWTCQTYPDTWSDAPFSLHWGRNRDHSSTARADQSWRVLVLASQPFPWDITPHLHNSSVYPVFISLDIQLKIQINLEGSLVWENYQAKGITKINTWNN